MRLKLLYILYNLCGNGMLQAYNNLQFCNSVSLGSVHECACAGVVCIAIREY